jgi:hypothetical protein
MPNRPGMTRADAIVILLIVALVTRFWPVLPRCVRCQPLLNAKTT